jgi:hypothetical protein
VTAGGNAVDVLAQDHLGHLQVPSVDHERAHAPDEAVSPVDGRTWAASNQNNDEKGGRKNLH